MNRTSIATKLRERLQKSHPEVMAAYLFGSVARGEARRSSDIDLAVLYRAAPSPTLEGLGISLQLQDVLEEELGKRVDVIVLNTAPVDLVQRVLRDGQLLIDRDPALRVEFEVRARHAFFDLQPVLRLYRQSGARRHD